MELDAFLIRWLGKEGGAERANYQMFLTEFCQTLDLPPPEPKGTGLGDYQFEAPVKSEAALGKKGTGRIDLYKRGCFILEAKQSQLKPGEAMPPDPEAALPEPVKDLFGAITGYAAPGGKRVPKYDRLMAEARIQAERYSLALKDHKPPPFLIVADIGRAFELYFDWSGDGRGYGFFPDQQSYRIALEDLRREDIRALIKGIWTDPASVDPRSRAAEVTRDIARRLSRVAEQLETGARHETRTKADHEVALGIEATSLFLMRVLFCMFAEDVGLLPENSFKQFLEEARGKSDQWWRAGLADLWARMDQPQEANRFWSYGDAIVRYFNGNLFSSARVYDLPQEFKGELYEAAKRDWRKVEPAIFGTLLEQVLTSAERAKLGAHYTPRPYVQRLVNATVGEVLRAEWEEVRSAVTGEGKSSPFYGEVAARSADGGGVDRPSGIEAAETPLHRSAVPLPTSGEDLEALRAFHTRLCAVRILDPACGTGNFLYVSMELLLQLEGEAIQLAAELGEVLTPAVHPNQFLGLELNPRAAVIAELVLWIGWLRHRLANHPDSIGDPVLPALTNINGGTHGGYDAVLRRTETGEPDEAALLPDWPEADFIVGNPPFIGGKDIRSQLGGNYAESLWRANRRVPKSADFVMHWWDRAAHILTRPGSRLRRFGFVTTNSITQTFSRRVIEGWLAENPPRARGGGGEARGGGLVQASEIEELDTPLHRASAVPLPVNEEDLRKLHLHLAIADHPWTRATRDAAAVRIAMTVAVPGEGEGTLLTVIREAALDKDVPEIETAEVTGRINADLTVGADVTNLPRLRANRAMAHKGFQLNGEGFVVSHQIGAQLGANEQILRRYFIGSDINTRDRGLYALDLFPLDEKEARQRHPKIYQYLLERVRPERLGNPIDYRRENWWLFGQPSTEIRDAVGGLRRFIATPRQGKYRLFTFVDSGSIVESTNVVIASDDAAVLGILQSIHHEEFSLAAGGWMGVGNDPRYFHTQTFSPFPFPDATPQQRAAIAELAEELDATRKTALAETPGLTMTEIYNWREKLRAGAELSAHEQDRAREARAGIVDRLHQQIDAAVADAYGWAGDLAPSEIVARLVALNAERAAEEREGHIRWLRPEYQVPRFGPKA